MPAEIRIIKQENSTNTTKIEILNEGETVLLTSKHGEGIQITGTENGFISSSQKSEIKIETPQTGLIITCPDSNAKVSAILKEV